MNSLNTALRAPVLAASIALLMSPGIARTEEGVQRESVRYGDLDLAAVNGQATLESRIRGASGRVCEDGDRRNLVAVRDARRCREESFARGMIEAEALFAVAGNAAAAVPAVTCKEVPQTVAVVATGRDLY